MRKADKLPVSGETGHGNTTKDSCHNTTGNNQPEVGRIMSASPVLKDRLYLTPTRRGAEILTELGFSAMKKPTKERLFKHGEKNFRPVGVTKFAIVYLDDEKGHKEAEEIAKCLVFYSDDLRMVTLACHDEPLGRIEKLFEYPEFDIEHKLPRAVDAAPRITLKNIGPSLPKIFQPEPLKYHFQTADQVKKMPPPTWLIEDIIPENAFVLLYGPYGSGKSFITLDMVLSVNSGIPMDCARKMTKQGLGVYISGEGGNALGSRLKAWDKGHKNSVSDPARILTVMPNLLSEPDTDELIRAINTLPDDPSIIVVDTLARAAVGGDENSARDMGMFINNVERLRREYNCAVLVVHHTGKDKNGEERGSAALAGAADVKIKVTKDEAGHIKVKCEKMKDAVEFKPFHSALEVVDLEDNQSSCYVVSTDNRNWSERTLSEKQQNGLDLLRYETQQVRRRSGLPGLTHKQWLEVSQLPKSTFNDVLKALIQKDLVETIRTEKKPGNKFYRPVVGPESEQGPEEVQEEFPL